MTQTNLSPAPSPNSESRVHRSAEEMDLAYAAIKMFSDFGCMARKPLAPGAVEELRTFWGRIQQLVTSQELSIALARRCVAGTARYARRLAGDAPRIGAEHVREAVLMVRAESTATAGLICRDPLS